MNTLTSPARPAAAPMQPPQPFVKPKPGSWVLDSAHCERPLPRIAHRLFSEGFAAGFREGFAKYGALLETIEMQIVNGFLYTCVRPIGAPPEPKGTPPKLILKLILRLHPEMRRRLRRAEQVWLEKPWREDTRRYLEEWMAGVEKESARLLSVSLRSLDDAALARHVSACHALVKEDVFTHHRINCSRVVPVGDFIAHVQAWTGAPVTEVLNILRGFSPDSRLGLAEMEKLASLVRGDSALALRLRGGEDAEALIADLEGRGDAVGEAARAWIGKVGHNITGFSPGYPTLREIPATLLESLRGVLAAKGPAGDDAAAAGRKAAEAMRARVPAEHRAEFDLLLEEAKLVHFLRDHACLRGTAVFGILRLGALEAGRRLAARGRIPDPEAALDVEAEELNALLLRGEGPAAEELQKRLDWRRFATLDDVPEVLGPVPGDPPPADLFPPGAARLLRAFDVYIKGMFEEAKRNEKGTLIKGLPASGGKRIGIARLVLNPGDFDRVGQGDVLVARVTTPTYNVLLPLLAGIVTDRGGILSHPAIVSREFGIPGVVGTKNATALIPDGARVEIDGDAGTVRVLP
jgi:phosphohistidine swiveling domain-containing protein